MAVTARLLQPAPMRVAVVGMGYVGLTTAVALAWLGHRVHGVETNAGRLHQLRLGKPPFFERGLADTLAAVHGRLTFSDSPADVVGTCDVVFLTVGTPAATDGSVDLRQLWTAAGALAAADSPDDLVVVNKATSPPGTLQELADRLPGRLHLASNPEFLRQGRALTDTLYPERIVVGATDALAEQCLRDLYLPVLEGGFDPPPGCSPPPSPREPVPFLTMDPRSAELAKYAANAFLATKVTFANEIANVCEAVGADVNDVVAVMGTDPRIGPEFLRPGVGYGGACLPKDTAALAHFASAAGYDFRLLRGTIEVNDGQWQRAVTKLECALGSLDRRTIAVLGLAFKAGTDDLRGATSLEVIQALLARGSDVVVHDPLVSDAAGAQLPPGSRFHAQLAEALSGADAALLLTDSPEYRQIDASLLAGMRGRVVVDGRNALDPARLAGFTYIGTGRRSRLLVSPSRSA